MNPPPLGPMCRTRSSVAGEHFSCNHGASWRSSDKFSIFLAQCLEVGKTFFLENMQTTLKTLNSDWSFQEAAKRNPWLNPVMLTDTAAKLTTIMLVGYAFDTPSGVVVHACSLLIRFLGTTMIRKQHLEKYAKQCLQISSKFILRTYFQLGTFKCEMEILNALDWNIHIPTVFTLSTLLDLNLCEKHNLEFDRLLHFAARDPSYFICMNKTVYVAAAYVLLMRRHKKYVKSNKIKTMCKHLCTTKKKTMELAKMMEAQIPPHTNRTHIIRETVL